MRKQWLLKVKKKQSMADTETVMKAVTQVAVEAPKATIPVMIKAKEDSRTPAQSAGHTTAAEPARSRRGGLCLKQPISNWGAENKYAKCKQFTMG